MDDTWPVVRNCVVAVGQRVDPDSRQLRDLSFSSLLERNQRSTVDNRPIKRNPSAGTASAWDLPIEKNLRDAQTNVIRRKGVVVGFPPSWNGWKLRGRRFTFDGACKFCVRFDEQRRTFACYVLQTAYRVARPETIKLSVIFRGHAARPSTGVLIPPLPLHYLDNRLSTLLLLHLHASRIIHRVYVERRVELIFRGYRLHRERNGSEDISRWTCGDLLSREKIGRVIVIGEM